MYIYTYSNTCTYTHLKYKPQNTIISCLSKKQKNPNITQNMSVLLT